MFQVRLFEARTLSWWADQRSAIDFEPPYQRRGGLWTTRDKAFLIDSIVNSYDVPKLYIADFTFYPSRLNRTNSQYAVIDGKQRFEAIFDFIDGNLLLDREFVFSENPELSLGRLGYKDLKTSYPTVASRFDNFNLTVMSVITDEEGKINELFVRLNRNKTLTGPEIRNAMQGIVPELIRKLCERPFFKESISFTTQRGQDLDAAAKFLLVEFRGRLTETKKAALDRFVDEGIEADAQPRDFKRAAARVAKVVDEMARVFTKQDPLLSSQGSLVPYYWLVRETAPDTRAVLRRFLVEFEELRRRNRELAKDQRTVSQVDPELSQYDSWNRSINDGVSIEGRFRVLTRRLRMFQETGTVERKLPAQSSSG